MGKYTDGINGPFSGKVGPVVGAKWLDQNVMRSLPKARTSPFTPGEIQQQEKFKLMTGLLKPLSALLNKTFNSVAVRMTGYNKGYSFNLKNAIRGSHPGLTIDYSTILLSRGDLPNAERPRVISSEPGMLSFSWDDNTGSGIAKGIDHVFVAAYSEEKDAWIYRTNVALRNEVQYMHEVISFSGLSVHTYIGMMSADGEDASDSIYTGLVTVL